MVSVSSIISRCPVGLAAAAAAAECLCNIQNLLIGSVRPDDCLQRPFRGDSPEEESMPWIKLGRWDFRPFVTPVDQQGRVQSLTGELEAAY